MKSVRGTSVFTLVLIFLLAQGKPKPPDQVPQLNLEIKDLIPVATEYATPVLNPVKCDAKGNVYLRAYQYPSMFSAPILKVSSEGIAVAKYSLESVPGFEKSHFYDFVLGPRGEVDLLAGRVKEEQIEVDIVAFREDGSYSSTTKLEPVFTPARFAAFPSGQFLVTGRQSSIQKGNPPEAGGPKYEPFTVIFDRSGRVIKRMELPGDVKLQEPTEAADKSSTSGVTKPPQPPPLSEIFQGEAATGDDGNIYVMRQTSRPLVYVISGDGEVIRSFEVKPPSDQATAWAMKYGAGGKLALMFAVPADQKAMGQTEIFSLVDAETGERVIDYKALGQVGGAFACYSPNGFTFLSSTKDHHLAIQHAVPH